MKPVFIDFGERQRRSKWRNTIYIAAGFVFVINGFGTILKAAFRKNGV